MSTVNRENVQAWVNALRSGEYKQATGKLRNMDYFCCLGVACEISKLGQWVSNEYYVVDGERWDGTLHPRVIGWLGLMDDIFGHNPRLNGIDLRDDDGTRLLQAAELNDAGASFAEIADAIERTYLTEPTPEQTAARSVEKKEL